MTQQLRMVGIFTALATVIAFVLVAVHFVSRQRLIPPADPKEKDQDEKKDNEGKDDNQAKECSADPLWPKTEAEAKKVWATIEIAARKRIDAYKASRSIEALDGSPNWTAKRGPYWNWVLSQSLAPAFKLAKVTSGPCLWQADETTPMGSRLMILADHALQTVGNEP